VKRSLLIVVSFGIALVATASVQARPIPIFAAVTPKVALSAPKPGTRMVAVKTLTYSVKAGRPVTWWYTVSDSNGRFIYDISVFKGLTSSSLAAWSGVAFVYHQQIVQKRWTWLKPMRGTYRVCAIALDSGPVRGGNAETCQLVQVS
jgi:hypothetical protein